MSFPKGILLLKEAAIKFVHFDNILSHAKKARDGHLTGYVEVRYPESIEYLFFRDGDTVTAAQRTENRFEECPMEKIIEKAKKAHYGTVNIHQIGEDLLNMILSIFMEEPIFANKDAEEIDMESLFERLNKLNFQGFLALKKGEDYSFVKFQNGKPDLIYPTNKKKQKIDLSSLVGLLCKEKGILISGYKGIEQKKQANPALIELYLKFLNSMTESFTRIVGSSIVRKTLLPAHENASRTSELLENFIIKDDLSIRYTPFIATDKEITESFTLWIDQFSDAIFVVLGRKTDEIIYNCIKDYRFALKSAGFFENSKLSRLDI